MRSYDTGTLRIEAKNAIGESEKITTLSVTPRVDFRSQLRHSLKCNFLLFLLKSVNSLNKMCYFLFEIIILYQGYSNFWFRGPD